MSNYLIHYGVKGMKWGVRHDYIPKNRKKSSKDKGIVDVIGEEATIKLATYATMAAVILGYHGAKRISDLHKQNWFTEKYKPSDIKRTKTNKEHDLKVINPIPNMPDTLLHDFAYGKPLDEFSEKDQSRLLEADKNGWFTNCVYCTTASALRRKGYDVEAKNSPGRGHTTSQTMKWWHGATLEDFYNHKTSNRKEADDFISNSAEKFPETERVEKVLSKQGTGSYGDLRIKTGEGNGHSVEYAVEKDGVIIYDNQCKVRMPLNDYMSSTQSKAYAFIQLDNCNPDLEAMLKDHVIKPRGR